MLQFIIKRDKQRLHLSNPSVVPLLSLLLFFPKQSIMLFTGDGSHSRLFEIQKHFSGKMTKAKVECKKPLANDLRAEFP